MLTQWGFNMAKVLVTQSYLTDIANAIRGKKNTNDIYYPEQMAGAITSIPGGTPVLKLGTMLPDTELVKTWNYDTWLVEDEEMSVPSWSTSAVTVRASQEMSETYTVNTTNYDYYILERMLTIPTYSDSTVAKGRIDYHIGAGAYELVTFPANTIPSLNGTKKYTTQTRAMYATGAYYRSVYWSSPSAITAYSTSVYSTAQVIVAPTISSAGAITIKTPTWSMRGSTTYFTESQWKKITDIRYQFIAELYRAPKGSLNLDGWGVRQQAESIFANTQTTNHTLT